MDKRKIFNIGLIIIVVIIFGVVFIFKDKNKDIPPKFALNGTELDLANINVSDLNNAGFYLQNNDNKLQGDSFKTKLSYFKGEDRTISMGGVSILNRGKGEIPYEKSSIFEITAKSKNKDNNETGLKATYNGKEFFGKTKEELISQFGEPDEEKVSYELIYKSKNKKYRTTFTFDTETKECYYIEIDRYEEKLAR